MKPYCLTLLTLVALTTWTQGHGVPTVITLNAERTGLVAPPRAGVVVLVNGETDSDEPGLGFGVASAAPPVGTRLGLEAIGGLLYWDGTAIIETDATFTIEAPAFDHFSVPNTSAVSEYVVDVDSGAMTGMTWSAYGGGDFWHANGFFSLDASAGEPLPGVYGVPIRVVTMPGASQLAATAPFLLPVFYDPAGVWTGAAAFEGIAALESTLVTPGDFNADGLVDAHDYAQWSANYAATDASTGDANGDGLVNAADYTVWRDASVGSATPAIPEPTTLTALATVMLSLGALRHR